LHGGAELELKRCNLNTLAALSNARVAGSRGAVAATRL
jgi:hypothetical protein